MAKWGMARSKLKRGTTVWARFGGFGWSTATVRHVERGKKPILLRRTDGGNAYRMPAALEPRDPDLNGKDKPSRLDAEASYNAQYGL